MGSPSINTTWRVRGSRLRYDQAARVAETLMTADQQWLLDHCIECDGAEVSRAWWEDAEVLVDLGHVTISGPRGPNGSYKRITPT